MKERWAFQNNIPLIQTRAQNQGQGEYTSHIQSFPLLLQFKDQHILRNNLLFPQEPPSEEELRKHTYIPVSNHAHFTQCYMWIMTMVWIVLGLCIWVLKFWLFNDKKTQTWNRFHIFKENRCTTDTNVFKVGYDCQRGRQSDGQKYHGLEAMQTWDQSLAVPLTVYGITGKLQKFLIFTFLICKKRIIIHTSCDSCVKWYDLGGNTKPCLPSK